MGSQEIQSESHESSECSYIPSSSCHPCGPHPWPASVQRRSIFLLQQQQQLCQQEHKQTNLRRCRREVLLGWRHTFLDRQPGLGRRHRGTWSWCPGSRCSRSHHPRCPQRGPTEPGLQLLWKEEEASQLWRSTSPGGAGAGGQDLDGEERFFLPTGQGCTCNNGRRRRQAPG